MGRERFAHMFAAHPLREVADVGPHTALNLLGQALKLPFQQRWFDYLPLAVPDDRPGLLAANVLVLRVKTRHQAFRTATRPSSVPKPRLGTGHPVRRGAKRLRLRHERRKAAFDLDGLDAHAHRAFEDLQTTLAVARRVDHQRRG
jgi:hypothetical protein